MTNDLPNAGDLARVVECCGCPQSHSILGHYVRVSRIVFIPLGMCGWCLRHFPNVIAAETDSHRLVRAHLRRVPPLAELEAADTVRELESEMPRRIKEPVCP